MKQYLKLALLGVLSIATLRSEEQSSIENVKDQHVDKTQLKPNQEAQEPISQVEVDQIIARALQRENDREEVAKHIPTELRDNFTQALYSNNVRSVRSLIKHHPILINDTIIGEPFIGKNLALAQFLHSEMKKQKRAFTGLIFNSWLQGAVSADAIDVVTWLLETIATPPMKSIIVGMLTTSDIVPGGKVEKYFRENGLLDTNTMIFNN
ncbi:MAG: hypothetical protein UV38_C0003G0088 [candidate division TM6 bacterium GW2011_GWE2_42_60]|nr:MAG: hypothetical protein UV38_C0003G0088 [candidate division TM6 bacterium GW2011_GWE2_42_60]HBY05432.1 hypothetical protein [Candidatus Dependentiae bacterium]